MQKLLLLSVLITTVALASTIRSSVSHRQGFKLLLLRFAAFMALYVLALRYLYPRLG